MNQRILRTILDNEDPSQTIKFFNSLHSRRKRGPIGTGKLAEAGSSH